MRRHPLTLTVNVDHGKVPAGDGNHTETPYRADAPNAPPTATTARTVGHRNTVLPWLCGEASAVTTH
jgi:hypothetical protein